MEKSILITGGARSGKSLLAERLTLKPSGKAIYMATAQALDSEMAERIEAHKARRGPEWSEIHASFDLVEALKDSDGGAPRLVDCLTLWLTNLMLNDYDWQAEVDKLVALIPTLKTPVVFVTNEVGYGIVPDNKLARDFRDAAGWMNHQVADACDTVIICVAGQALTIKPASPG